MARNNSGGAGAMLDGLKSRLGFNRNDNDDFYDDDYEDDLDDDYDEFGDGRDDEPAAGGFKPLSAGSGSSRRSRFGRADSAASNLVSIDDVKERTRSDRAQRDSYAADRDADGRSRDSYSSRAATAPASAPYDPAPSRSEGYDSMFEPTEEPVFTPYDPYEAYSNSNPTTYASVRSLTVIKPVVYGDVERVARAVKSGDVVVLVMRNTPDDLSKRILDFSFGVASALDANVECPGDKVFAIARGNGLSEDEKASLRNQGAL